MNDRMKESLSALVDGETDELEVRRILNQVEEDSELRDSWQRYQMIGSLMRDEPVATTDLSRGIMQAIEGEPMDEVPTDHEVNQEQNGHRQTKRSVNWIASAAVAASVTIAVLLGMRLNLDLQQQDLVADAELSGETVEQRLVSNPVDAVELEQAQRKLQEYVLQHTENAALNTGRGMMPFARVASFDESGSSMTSDVEVNRDMQDESKADAVNVEK